MVEEGTGTRVETPTRRAASWAATTPRYQDESARDGWKFKCKCCASGLAQEGFCSVCWDANCTEHRSRHETGDAKTVANMSTEPSRAAPLAAKGVRTGVEFADLMTALMDDVLARRVTPGEASAALNASGQLLKVVEMSYRLGVRGDDGVPQLQMAPEVSRGTDDEAERSRAAGAGAGSQEHL